MAEKTAEHLSALIDGECPTAEIDLALRRIAKESELQARWQRYHLISDVLRKNLPDQVDNEFCQRIRSAIDEDSNTNSNTLPGTATAGSRTGWYKPVTGVAIAASLAAAITFSLDYGAEDQDNAAGTPAAIPPLADAGTATPAPIASEPLPDQLAPTTAASPVPTALESKFNRYLISHNEQASMTSLRGIMPYVTMVNVQGGR